jgi:hypothetical protein
MGTTEKIRRQLRSIERKDSRKDSRKDMIETPAKNGDLRKRIDC